MLQLQQSVQQQSVHQQSMTFVVRNLGIALHNRLADHGGGQFTSPRNVNSQYPIGWVGHGPAPVGASPTAIGAAFPAFPQNIGNLTIAALRALATFFADDLGCGPQLWLPINNGGTTPVNGRQHFRSWLLQVDLIEFLNGTLASGFLTRGDVLVMDNARVHTEKTHWNEILDLLLSNGVTLVRLPTYSPELNPCELVFASVKKFMQSQPDSIYHNQIQVVNDMTFLKLLNNALKRINQQELANYYRHCRHPKDF